MATNAKTTVVEEDDEAVVKKTTPAASAKNENKPKAAAQPPKAKTPAATPAQPPTPPPAEDQESEPADEAPEGIDENEPPAGTIIDEPDSEIPPRAPQVPQNRSKVMTTADLNGGQAPVSMRQRGQAQVSAKKKDPDEQTGITMLEVIDPAPSIADWNGRDEIPGGKMLQGVSYRVPLKVAQVICESGRAIMVAQVDYAN